MIEGLVKWWTCVILVINLHILSYLALKSVVKFLYMTEANNLYTPKIAWEMRLHLWLRCQM